MALTSYGYTGQVTTTQMAQMANHLGFEYVVHGANDMKVSIVTGQTRQVILGPGSASGSCILDINDANLPLTLPNVTSGAQWFLVGLRRVWQSTKATFFDYIDGTSSPTIPVRPATPSNEDFQPLALVQVTAGQTVPTAIRDLRAVGSNNGTLIGYDDLLRSYLDGVGTVVYINGTEWLRTANSSGVPSWVERGALPQGLVLNTSSHWSDNAQLRSSGGVVTLHGRIKKSGTASAVGGEVTILSPGVIPIDRRPPYEMTTLGVMFYGSGATSHRQYPVTAYTDGSVKAAITQESGSLGDNGILRFDLTWIP